MQLKKKYSFISKMITFLLIDMQVGAKKNPSEKSLLARTCTLKYYSLRIFTCKK